MLQRTQVFLFRPAFELHLFRLRVFGMQPAGRHAGVGATVGNTEAVPVAVLAGEGQLRDRLAADGHTVAGAQEQQPPGLYRRHRAVQRGQPRQKAGVGFLRLVDVRHRHPGKAFRQLRREFVALGYLLHHLAQRGAVIRHLPA